MRVGVDGRALRANRPRRGIAIYLEQLLAELARLHPEDEYRVLVPGAARAGAVPENVEVVGVGGSGRALHAAAALAGRPRLDRLLRGPDLIWAPAPAPLAVSRETPFVLTVHDLSFVHRPRDYGSYERLWHTVARPRRLARRAQRVLTDSDAVRAELLDEWDLDPQRVRTVRPGPGRAPARRAAASERGLAQRARRRRPRAPQAADAARGGTSPSGRARAPRRPRLRGRRPPARRARAGRRDRARPAPRPGAGRRLRGRALPRLRVARGGLRLHAARGTRRRRAGRGLRPPGLPRDARRRGPDGPARTTRTRSPTRCCGWSASRSCARASWRPGAGASELFSWERAARETRAVFEEALA